MRVPHMTRNMKMTSTCVSVVLFILLPGFLSEATAQDTKLKWFGHAAFSITTPYGKVLLIDPWLTNPANPDAKDGKDPLVAVPKVDYILLTHGHRDHVGDAVAIAKKTGAILITNPELAGNLVKLADFPGKQAETGDIMGIGGEIQIAEGEVTIAMTPATHSSSVFNPKAGPNEPERAYGGNPAGFIIIIKNGPTIYHTGDTAYFKDMETIGEELFDRCRAAQHWWALRHGTKDGSENRAISTRQAGNSSSFWNLSRHRPKRGQLCRRTQKAEDRFLRNETR